MGRPALPFCTFEGSKNELNISECKKFSLSSVDITLIDIHTMAYGLVAKFGNV